MTPLMIALKHKDEEMVMLLLRNGAEIKPMAYDYTERGSNCREILDRELRKRARLPLLYMRFVAKGYGL